MSGAFVLPLHPRRRCGLDSFDELADRHGPRQRTGNMHVIRHSSDAKCFTADATARTSKVRMKAILDGWRNPWFSLFGAEHNMQKDSGKGLRHRGFS
jgi:hypothetical protein